LVSRGGPNPAGVVETGGFDSLSLTPRGAALRAVYLRCAPVPSFPGDPPAALPCSQTPGGPPRQTIAALRCCPRYHQNEGSPLRSNFEAQSHGFTARCLRLKAPFRTPAKARFRWMVSPFRAGWFPPGLTSGFQLLVFSFSFRLVVAYFRAPSPPLGALAGAS